MGETEADPSLVSKYGHVVSYPWLLLWPKRSSSTVSYLGSISPTYYLVLFGEQNENPFFAHSIWQTSKKNCKWRLDLANFGIVWASLKWWTWMAFFCQTLCADNFLLGEKSLVKSTFGHKWPYTEFDEPL